MSEVGVVKNWSCDFIGLTDHPPGVIFFQRLLERKGSGCVSTGSGFLTFTDLWSRRSFSDDTVKGRT